MPPDQSPREETARDRAQRLVQEATERLAAELKAGRSDALKRYLTAMGRFHRYSFTNMMLIQSQNPNATRVAGYHTWRDLGRSVRRGEKGIVIYAPVARRAKAQDLELPLKFKDASADRPEPVGFRAAYVFDVSQTEGQPLPEPSRTLGAPGPHLERLKEVVARRGIELVYFDASELIMRADGYSTGGRIKLRPALDPAEEFSVLAHELAHEMLHHGPDRREFTRKVRETQAEAVAYVVSRAVGLETNRAASDYISLYNGDAKTLTESLEAVQRTSSEILRELSSEERYRTKQEPTLDSGARETLASRSGDEVPPRSELLPPEPKPGDSLSLDR